MSVVTMNRVVFGGAHIFAPERVGWSGISVIGESQVHIAITIQSGTNRFLLLVVTDSYSETYWGSAEHVIDYAMTACGEGLYFPKDNLMNQSVERVLMERFNRSEATNDES